MLSRLTRTYDKPAFGLSTTTVDGASVPVNEEILLRKPFCRLVRFRRQVERQDPKVLLVAPMSGHFATLLRGTVEALLPEHDVHITDWADAGEVPLSHGSFDLDDYMDYLIEFLRYLNGLVFHGVPTFLATPGPPGCFPVKTFLNVALKAAVEASDKAEMIRILRRRWDLLRDGDFEPVVFRQSLGAAGTVDRVAAAFQGSRT